MTTAQKTRFRAPTVERYVDVSLDDFLDEQIIEYLRHRGYSVDGKPDDAEVLEVASADGIQPLTLSVAELNGMNTLALCGQQESARDWLIELVSKHISRQL